MIGRGILAAAAALALAVVIVRNAAVDAWSDIAPKSAASYWPNHPDVELSLAMVGIAEAMRDGRKIDPSIFAKVNDAADKAPLESQPFLVRGVQAKLAGDDGLADRAFLAAQQRDPRSLPAAYFLADHYLQRGDAVHGLRQIAALARLMPNGPTNVAPYLATYAKDRSTWPLLRSLFRTNPQIQDAALIAIAKDSASPETVLALADASHRSPNATWVPPLLDGLIKAGQYGRARAVWANVSRVNLAPGTLLYDADFASSTPPPPFNWQLMSSSVGVAERQPGGQLHAMYYGQEDGPLASQLLLLPPGTYRLSLRLVQGASNPGSLVWSIRCDKAQREFSRIALDAAAARGWTFQVPAGCGAQWLALLGVSADMPEQSDVTVANLRLTGGPGA